MKVAVKTLGNKDAGQIDLDDAIFGVEVREDILHRMVKYQLNKRQQGTHKTKQRHEINGTGKKPWAQKGTGLKTALSAKAKDGKLVILEDAKAKDHKTKTAAATLGKFGFDSVLIVDGKAVDTNFQRATNNLPKVDVLPSIGANVYDILRRDTLVLTKEAVADLTERLKG